MKILLNACSIIASLYIISAVIQLLKIAYRGVIKRELLNFKKELCNLNFVGEIAQAFVPEEKGNVEKVISKRKMITYGLIATVLLGVLNLVVPNSPIGIKRIGALFEKREYITHYYVELFPDGSETKNYKVIAEIWAKDNSYHLQKAYFPNGGYITVEEDYGDSLNFDEEVSVRDKDGKHWKAQLVDERPTLKRLEELR